MLLGGPQYAKGSRTIEGRNVLQWKVQKSISGGLRSSVRWAEGASNAATYMLCDRQAVWRLISQC